MKRVKYAAVGTGGRIPMFIDPIVSRFRDCAELVGLCDPSRVRRTYHQQRLISQYGAPEVPTYDDFDRMLAEQKPDVVIVCTPDYLHHHYIVRSLEFGADVVSEKPLTIDADKWRQIYDAVQRTGRRVRTTFNLRWGPGSSKVRELIAAGEIGRVRHIDFEYFLDTSHGADYFRRWHSYKKYSGGLLLHKSTHHFDVLNWWLDAIPSRVFAEGGLVFYGKKNAVERGDEALTRYPRYTGTPEAAADPFRLTLDSDPQLKALYLDAEEETGYIRDQNVFRDGIDIEDSMSLIIKYRTGAVVSYSLNAYSPREGFRASISGDRGRIEYEEAHAGHVIKGDEKAGPEGDGFATRLILQKHFGEPREIAVPRLEGGHGGGDPLLQEQIFSLNPPPDPLMRSAGHEQGAASLLIGAAANVSMASGQPVEVNDLFAFPAELVRLSQLT
jgi:predicted dehydrogenase